MTAVSKNTYLAQQDIKRLEESLEQLKDNPARWAQVQREHLRDLLAQARERLAEGVQLMDRETAAWNGYFGITDDTAQAAARARAGRPQDPFYRVPQSRSRLLEVPRLPL
jgi:hypothetical protein